MTHADLIEALMPLFLAVTPENPARGMRAHVTWWSRTALRRRVSA